MTIKIKYHAPIAKMERIVQGDWIDLRAAEDVTLKAGEYRLISLGVSIRLPRGYEAHIVPRSSTFKNWGILQTNSMGVVDESYAGGERYLAHAGVCSARYGNQNERPHLPVSHHGKDAAGDTGRGGQHERCRSRRLRLYRDAVEQRTNRSFSQTNTRLIHSRVFVYG